MLAATPGLLAPRTVKCPSWSQRSWSAGLLRITAAHFRPGRFQAFEAEVAVSVYPAAVPVYHAGELRDLVEREDAAEGVGRAAEDQQMAAGPEGLVDRVQVEREEATILLQHPDLDDLPAEIARHGQERHIGGRGQDDR